VVDSLRSFEPQPARSRMYFARAAHVAHAAALIEISKDSSVLFARIMCVCVELAATADQKRAASINSGNIPLSMPGYSFYRMQSTARASGCSVPDSGRVIWGSAVQGCEVELVDVDDANGRVRVTYIVAERLAAKSDVHNKVHGSGGTTDI
jgi:hypothetical protein